MWEMLAALVVLVAAPSLGQYAKTQGSDWYLRFHSERGAERVETVAYHVRGTVKHRYSIIQINREVFNPSNETKEYLLRAVLPPAALVTHVSIGTAELMRGNLTEPQEEGANSTARERWRGLGLPLLLPPRENTTLSVTYEEEVPVTSPLHYRLELFLDVGEVVRDGHFSVMVEVAEERPVRGLVVRTLHPVIGDITAESVEEAVEGDERWARANLSMNTREQACYFGSAGVHGELVLEWHLSSSSPPLLLSSSPSASPPLLLSLDPLLAPLLPATSYSVPKEYEEECQSSSTSSTSSPSSPSSSSSSSSPSASSSTAFSSLESASIN